MENLTEVELDYSYSQGFLEQWLKDAPTQVKEHLGILVAGVSAYREKYVSAQEEILNLRGQYNTLTATSAQYLQKIQNLKDQLDEALIESQKELHSKNSIETP